MNRAAQLLPLLLLLDVEANQPSRRRNRRMNRARRRAIQVFRPFPDLATMEERDIIRKFRLNRQTIMDLCQQLEPDLIPRNMNPTAITPLVKIMSVLQFLATGSFQYTVAVSGGMSQPTFSVVLLEVLSAMLKHSNNFIQFPKPEDFANVKGAFYALAHLPHVIGAIDGTHIALVPPHLREQVFRNRRNFHSINVQVVCLADLYITSVCARFPGSAHDSFVLRNSNIPQQMSQLGPERAWLVGDSAYPNRPWLLAPLRNPTTPGEVRFNDAHRKIRRPVEKAFGLLKSRFRCLDKIGGALLYSPEKVCKITLVCCMLHNLALRRNIPLIGEEAHHEDPLGEDDESANEDDSGEEEGNDIRQDVINNFFA